MRTDNHRPHAWNRAGLCVAGGAPFATGPAELDRRLRAGDHVVAIDVREPEDFARGHVPGALSLPEEIWDGFAGLCCGRTYVFYCGTEACHLAAQACVKFTNRGYRVLELKGGFAAWEAAGLEVEYEPLNRLARGGHRLGRPRC